MSSFVCVWVDVELGVCVSYGAKERVECCISRGNSTDISDFSVIFGEKSHKDKDMLLFGTKLL